MGHLWPCSGESLRQDPRLCPVDQAIELELACRGDPQREFISPPRPPVYSHTSDLGGPHTVQEHFYYTTVAMCMCSGLLVTLAKMALSSPLPHGNLKFPRIAIGARCTYTLRGRVRPTQLFDEKCIRDASIAGAQLGGRPLRHKHNNKDSSIHPPPFDRQIKWARDGEQ